MPQSCRRRTLVFTETLWEGVGCQRNLLFGSGKAEHHARYEWRTG
jgi:hypothetical protein